MAGLLSTTWRRVMRCECWKRYLSFLAFFEGVVGGEEEALALHPFMAPLHLVGGGAGAGGARPDALVDVVPVQPHSEDAGVGVLLHHGVRPVGERAWRLVAAQEGAN